jgi:hypothetical protein
VKLRGAGNVQDHALIEIDAGSGWRSLRSPASRGAGGSPTTMRCSAASGGPDSRRLPPPARPAQMTMRRWYPWASGSPARFSVQPPLRGGPVFEAQHQPQHPPAALHVVNQDFIDVRGRLVAVPDAVRMITMVGPSSRDRGQPAALMRTSLSLGSLARASCEVAA